MRLFYSTLTLAPAVLFLMGFVYSLLQTPAVCAAFPYEMAIMWFIMFLAHLSPWFIWYQQHFTRD